MHARITTLRTTSAQHDEGARIIVEQLVPWAQNASGYCGLLRLDSRETETTLVVTLWSTLGALEQSGEAIARMARSRSWHRLSTPFRISLTISS